MGFEVPGGGVGVFIYQYLILIKYIMGWQAHARKARKGLYFQYKEKNKLKPKNQNQPCLPGWAWSSFMFKPGPFKKADNLNKTSLSEFIGFISSNSFFRPP
jgi:hypothetical protein